MRLIQLTQNHAISSHYRISRCKFSSMTPVKVHWGHVTSRKVTNHFWLITFEWIMLETCGWFHRVCLVKTHRLICILTFLSIHLTLRSRDLRSKFDLDLFWQKSTSFDAPEREKGDDAKTNAVSRSCSDQTRCSARVNVSSIMDTVPSAHSRHLANFYLASVRPLPQAHAIKRRS